MKRLLDPLEEEHWTDPDNKPLLTRVNERDRMALDNTRAGGGGSPRLFLTGTGTDEDTLPPMRHVHKDRDVIQNHLRKDWFRNWLRMGVAVALVLVPLCAYTQDLPEPEFKAPPAEYTHGDRLDTASLFHRCIDDNMVQRAYCYGYLLGHYSAVAVSPTRFYCDADTTSLQMRMAFLTWVIERGGLLALTEEQTVPQNILYQVWVDARVCRVRPPTEVEAFDESEGGEVK